MEVHATISSEWRRRMLFMFFMIFGIAAWFLSDGYYFWPNEAERYASYESIKEGLIESGKAKDAESDQIRMAWERQAREMGHSSKIPSERTDAAIHEQRVIGWVMMAGVLIYGIWIAWNHRLHIRTEGETIIGASGQRVELDSIVGMDRKKWEKKGIAYAIYEEAGKQKRLCLDEHKFKGCEAIILEAEKRIEERANRG